MFTFIVKISRSALVTQLTSKPGKGDWYIKHSPRGIDREASNSCTKFYCPKHTYYHLAHTLCNLYPLLSLGRDYIDLERFYEISCLVVVVDLFAPFTLNLKPR